MFRAGAFFSWLLQQHPADAEAFRRFGLPPQSSRLYVLLRACKQGTQRTLVRRWHRRWRVHRRFAELEARGEIKRIDVDLIGMPPFDDDYIRGIKRSGVITLEFDFDLMQVQHDWMWFWEGDATARRWNRVVRRWAAKHSITRTCPSCETPVTLPAGQSFLPCPVCGSDK